MNRTYSFPLLTISLLLQPLIAITYHYQGLLTHENNHDQTIIAIVQHTINNIFSHTNKECKNP